MKIYVVGPPGAGKTTLAKDLSDELNIPYYELDTIIFDDENNHGRREDKEIKKLFNKIIKKDEWIIEDVGRSIFMDGYLACDRIYYLKFTKWQVVKRIIVRWYRQKRGLEEYNYPPTIYQLFDMIRVAISYFKKEEDKLNVLSEYEDKIIFFKKEDIEKEI